MSSYSAQRFRADKFRKREHVPCRYCGRLLTRSQATVDHKTPRSRGGSNQPQNFTIACFDCNNLKGSMTFEEFKAWPGLTLAQRLHLGVDATTWEEHAARLVAHANRRRPA